MVVLVYLTIKHLNLVLKFVEFIAHTLVVPPAASREGFE